MRYFYRLRESPAPGTSKVPFSWEPHKDDKCICSKDSRGWPAKRRKRVEVHEDNGSDTESGDEAEDHDLEKDPCGLFHRLSKNLHKLDSELAVVLRKNICSQFGLLSSHPKDLFNSVRSNDRNSLLKLVYVTFSLEREQLNVDNGNVIISRAFKILRKCQSKFDCLIYEMLFI